eukprot:103409_1
MSRLIHTNPFGIISPDELDDTMPQIEESEEYSIVPPSSVPHGEDDVDDYVPEPEIIQNYYEEEEEWRYNPNHSRGAQLMNGYDRNALNYEYPKGDAYLPKWQVIFQKLLYVAQHNCM